MASIAMHTGRSATRNSPPPRPIAPPAPRPAAPPPMPQFQPPQIQMPAPVSMPAPVAAPPVNGAPPILPSTPVQHVAMANPQMEEYLGRVRARLDAPADDTRALNQAGEAVKEFAQGQRNNANLSAVQRGVFGNSGAGGQISDDIGIAAQGNFAKAAENIALQRMRDTDSLLMGARDAFAEPGRMNLQDRALGIQAQGQQGSLDLQRARMTLDAQLANQGMAAQVAAQNMQAQLEAQRMAQAQYQMMLQAQLAMYR